MGLWAVTALPREEFRVFSFDEGHRQEILMADGARVQLCSRKTLYAESVEDNI